jgi:hypothetical protein
MMRNSTEIRCENNVRFHTSEALQKATSFGTFIAPVWSGWFAHSKELTMRLAILSFTALAFAVSPALAGGMGGCNWGAKQVTADVPVEEDTAGMFVSLEPIVDKWLVLQDDKAVDAVSKMIEETTVPVQQAQ